MPESVALEWLSRADIPLFLITPDMRLVWTNASAASLMRQLELHVNPFGHLRSANKDIELRAKDARQQLQAAIARRETWQGRATILTLTGFSGGTVRLYEFTIDGLALIGCAIIMEDEGAKDISVRLSQYGLTNTESKIITSLASGITAIEIARANGSSLLTVRTHIKRAYEKMEVNSREKMFARLTGRILSPSVGRSAVSV